MFYRPATEAADMVHPVACVSLPQSGHDLLVRLLFSLYRRRFGYCPGYRKDPPRECCGQFPCTQPRITIAKQHDFKLNQPVPTDRPIIVLYRRFDEAVVSNFEVRARHQPDTAKEFRKFAKRWAKFYSRFVTKWVEEPAATRKLIIRYERLTEHPTETMREVTAFLKDTRFDDRIPTVVGGIDHFSAGGKPDVTDRAGVVNFQSVESFRFYDRSLFKRLNAVAYASGPEI